VGASALPQDDDPSIAHEVALWRRIHPTWWVPNARAGQHEITSQAFQNYRQTNTMSVFLAAETSQEAVLAGHTGYGLAEFSAGLARSNGQGVVRAPNPEVAGHAHVVGNKTGRVKDALKKGCTILLEPTKP